MKYFLVFFVVIAVGIESRSLSPYSSIEEALTAHSDSAIESPFDISLTDMLPATEDPNSFSSEPLTEPVNEIEMKISIGPEDPRSFIISQIQKLDQLSARFTRTDQEEQVQLLNRDWQKKWLNQRLKFILDEVSEEKSSSIKPTVNNIAESTTPPLRISETGISFTNLVDSVEKFDIYDQEAQDDVGHVKSRYEDLSAPISLIQDDVPGLEVVDFFISEKTNERNLSEELDEIFSDLQNQVDRMRKYFERVCRKHISTSVETKADFGVDSKLTVSQPKNISMLGRQ